MSTIQLFPDSFYTLYEIEEDMCSKACQYESWDAISKVAYTAWKNSAIVGLYELSDEQRTDLFFIAQKIFSKLMVNPRVILSASEKQILSLSLIEIAKEPDAELEEGGLWNFIFSRLGYDSSQTGAQSPQVMYGAVRSILKSTAIENKRYFANNGQKYYNSICIHAFAPSWSVDNLINILFGFYSKNLEYHYEEGDNAFRILSSKIAQRWEDTGVNNETDNADISLRSDVLSSSFKSLFQNRPVFMAAFCDSIIGKIDELLRTGESNLDMNNRLDRFIDKWFKELSEKNRQVLSDRRKYASIQKVITQKKDIKPVYRFEDGCLSISLPRIRLPEITRRPTVSLFQNDTLITAQTLRTIGDDLCLTTREISIPLSSDPNVNWSKGFNFQIVITCGDLEIYNSAQELARPYIVLDQYGEEIRNPRVGAYTIYLLAPEHSKVDVVCAEDAIYQLNHKGQLYSIPLAVTQQVRINGRDIISDAGGRQTIGFYLSKQQEAGIQVKHNEKLYTVFDSPLTLFAVTDSQDLGKKYRIFLDSAEHSLAEYQWTETRFEVPVPRIPRYCHTIVVKDISSGKTAFELNYIILVDYSCQFDKDYYKNTSCDGSTKIRIGGRTVNRHFSLSPDQEEIEVPLWDSTLSAVIRVPKLSISLSDENALLLDEAIWHEDIEQSAFLSVHTPPEFEASFQLGGYTLPQTSRKNVYDLGNFLSSKAEWGFDSLPLGAIIRKKDGSLDQILLTDIVFRAHFTDSPVYEENRKIYWDPTGKYFGPDNSEFFVKIYHGMGEPDPFVYAEKMKQDVIEKRFPYCDGYYRVQVVLRAEESAFALDDECVLYEGTLKIGDPNTSRWKGKELHLTKVHYWSYKTKKEEIALLFTRDGIVTDMEYQGLSVPTVGNEEDPNAQLPEYSAYLRYEKYDGTRCYYNYREDVQENELINPIRFWVTTDNRILIETRAGEGVSLMVNIKRPPELKSKTVRLVYSLKRISHEEQKKYLRLADSFEFEEFSERE